MAKKKKAAPRIQRGYATTSLPKKQTTSEDTTVQNPTIDDEISMQYDTIASKTENVHDSSTISSNKSTTIITADQLVEKESATWIYIQEKAATLEQVNQLPRLQLPQDLEKKTANLWLELGADYYYDNENTMQDSPSLVRNLMKTYTVLTKIGFPINLIEQAMRATGGTNVADALDWLCIHAPLEEVPARFRDKFYHLDDDYLIFSKNELSQDNVTNTSKSSVYTKQVDMTTIKKKDDTEIVDDHHNRLTSTNIKHWVLEQYDEELEEDVNRQMYELLVRIKEKQQQHAEAKKNGESFALLDQMNKELRRLSRERDLLQNDPFMDEKVVEQLMKQHEKMEREHMITRKQQESRERKQPKLEDWLDQTTVDDDDMLGNLWDVPDDATAASTSQSTSVTLQVVDEIVYPAGWTGKAPKDILIDYCRKKDSQSRVTFPMQSNVCGVNYQVKVCIGWSSIERQIFSDTSICFRRKIDAENYMATTALYNLAQLTYLQLLPPPFQDYWKCWENERRDTERAMQRNKDQDMAEFLSQTVIVAKERNKLLMDELDTLSSNEAVASPNKQRKRYSIPREVYLPRNNIQEMHRLIRHNQSTFSYRTIMHERQQLPVYQFREQILASIQANSVVLLVGDTGCGKTTQVPQYIVEHALRSNPDRRCQVICTQPRRISAISISQRVSIEMGERKEDFGTSKSLVGYQVRLDNRTSATSALIYCTTGILLRRLESDPTLDSVTHLVLDEVQERTLESDFLLIVIRRLLLKRPDLRVVIMSATVDADKFTRYFNDCPVIHVPGRTFPVAANYLEDIIEMTDYRIETDSKYAKARRDQQYVTLGSVNITGKGGNTHRMVIDLDEDDISDMSNDQLLYPLEQLKGSYSNDTRATLARMDEDRINYDLIIQLLKYLCPSKILDNDEQVSSIADTTEVNENTVETVTTLLETTDITKDNSKTSDSNTSKLSSENDAILIFLPGLPEIRTLHELMLADEQWRDPKQYLLIPIHSLLAGKHQELAFEPPPQGVRKIILSTNLAETGITIPDVTVVIDTGKSKEIRYNEKKRISALEEGFIAQANARQRKGRAGRVQPGVCYHLFTRHRHDHLMLPFQTPEMQRLPLHEFCLRIKAYGYGAVEPFLLNAMDPPRQKSIQMAMEQLVEVGALAGEETAQVCQPLTPLGEHLARLPLDVHLAKMLVYATVLQCIDPILTIVAALSNRSIFLRPYGESVAADQAKRAFATGEREICRTRRMLPSDFCRKNYLDTQALRMIEDTKRQILSLLVSARLVNVDEATQKVLNRSRYQVQSDFCPIPDEANKYASRTNVVRAIIMAGLYPRVARRDFEHQRWIVRGKNTVMVHPSSINYETTGAGHNAGSWLAYYIMQQSGTTPYLWETTIVNAIAVILFGAEMNVEHLIRRVTLEDWIQFKCVGVTAAILRRLRRELNVVLRYSIHKPGEQLPDRLNRWLDMAIEVICA
ncbi:P-loop containing nucleoside triphosphate hydrolase protein [Syncephalis plumigaleata]|nr:P-loop containing nucleoside triphosphate hydrolase protein [Syncephalis plumigaleata]